MLDWYVEAEEPGSHDWVSYSSTSDMELLLERTVVFEF